MSTHSQSNDEIAHLQQQEEERTHESAQKIQEAKEKKAQWEAERCKEEAGPGKWAAAEVASPRGGKDQKRQRQKSPEVREEDVGEDEEDEERRDVLGALTESYKAQRRANKAYQGAVVAHLSGIRQVLLDGLPAFLVAQGSRFGDSGGSWGASEWKGKERDDGEEGQGTDGEDGDEEGDEGEEGGQEDGDREVV
ncbi:hypothetical protein BS17DRAFT_818894 [Gyrodon lividus]|nr:hypothetical protein BS17DRAFT_818894 [Gyrodon lividus]